ncbi:hypothetical protein BT93_F1644 [Corymbia citriodora subsp. variegata]|nr:hypothetical protein BT93_F1644 [Corymbia citriodora subsp. variegata]
MGSSSTDENIGQEEAGKKGRRWIGCGCGWAFAVSMAGGLMLGWWEHQYHRSNRQLWMVPVGLILFLTPLFAWLSLVISDLCSSSSSSSVSKDHRPSLVPTPHASIEVAVAGGGSSPACAR